MNTKCLSDVLRYDKWLPVYAIQNSQYFSLYSIKLFFWLLSLNATLCICRLCYIFILSIALRCPLLLIFFVIVYFLCDFFFLYQMLCQFILCFYWLIFYLVLDVLFNCQNIIDYYLLKIFSQYVLFQFYFRINCFSFFSDSVCCTFILFFFFFDTSEAIVEFL